MHRYVNCTQIETRKYFEKAYVNDTKKCSPETQTRSRLNDGAYGKWSGSYKFEVCSTTKVKVDYRPRLQSAGAKLPPSGKGCLSETQTRLQALTPSSSQWGRWSGSYVYSACIETDRKLVRDSANCTRRSTRTRKYSIKDGGASARDTVIASSWSATSYENVTVIASSWSATSYENVSGCKPGPPGPPPPPNPCKKAAEDKSRAITILTTTSCIETQSQKRFEATSVAKNAKCVSETQTRSRKMGTSGTQTWGRWSGSYVYQACFHYKVDVQNRSKWQSDLIRTEESNAQSICISELQARTRRNASESWSKWSGGYGFDQCIELESKNLTGYPCPAKVSRSRVNNRQWSPSSMTMDKTAPNCSITANFCAKKTPTKRYQSVAVKDSLCVSELGYTCTPTNTTLQPFYVGKFSSAVCTQLQTRVRWQTLTAKAGSSCISEAQTRELL